MSRVFSVPTVLRMVPHDLLRRFLDRLGLPDLPGPWDGPTARDPSPLVRALADLPAAAFDAVEAALHTVHDLACESGLAAIREAADPGDGGPAGPAADMPADAGLYHRAMWAWLHHPDVVARAALLHQVDHLTWWRRRDDLPRAAPDLSPDALGRLGRAVSDVLLAEQGRGRACTVEALPRRGTVYLFAHPDDFVQAATAHDDRGRLAPVTFRRTFTVVYAFRPAAGSVELYAKVPARVKPRLEAAFADAVLGFPIGDWRPPPVYALNGLKAPDLALETDPADGVTVHVRQLRLALRNSNRQITLKADPAWPGDMRRMLAEVLDKERVPLSAVAVTLATLCFEFAAAGRRRAGSVTFDVAYPSSCGLRNQPADRVELVTKYLRRWGIDASEPDGPGLGASG